VSAGSHPQWQPPEGFADPVPPDPSDPPSVHPGHPPPPPASWPPPPVRPQYQQPPQPSPWSSPWQQQYPMPPVQLPPGQLPPGYWQPQPQPWQPPLEAVAPTPPPESSRLRLVTLLMIAGVLLVIGAGIFLDHTSSESGGRVFDFSDGQSSKGGEYTEIDVDGRSSLPGDHLSISYTPLSGEREWVDKQSIDAPDDGSTWWLTRPHAGRDDQIFLAYYVYRPPIDSAERRTEFEHRMFEGNSALSKDGVSFSRPRIAGREALKYEYDALSGKRILQVRIIGPVDSYQFECRIAPDNSEMWSQCRSMLQTLKIND
jgi:hypothetical protein